jgi:hypothetical protein
MPLTERQRHDAYEALQQAFGDHTDTVIELLRPDHDRLATREDVALGLADVRREIAEVRVEMAELRTELKTEMAHLRTELKTEMRDLTTGQTRTMMLGLVGSVTALAVTQIVVAAL